MERLRVLKSNKNAHGTVACDNTTMHLLQANDFVGEAIRKESGICHHEAQMIWQAMQSINIEGAELLFVESVSNLVCPASFDLGEDCRVTLIASTEGDDKPKKYPRMFLTSELMLISKADLLPYVPFSIEAVTKDALEVNPKIEVLTISSTSGEGIDKWFEWLMERVEEKKMEAALKNEI